MPRKWLGLVAWVTLATFIAANGPLSARARPAGWPCRHAADEPPANDPVASSVCKHCRAKPQRQAPAETAPTKPDRPTKSPDRSCPCQEGGSCPCPGGCMYCSVAKAACCGRVATVTVQPPCLGQDLPEDSLHFPPPHCSKLIRPPRA